MNNGKVIIIEGIIGAGKTTFANLFADELNCTWLAEPDEKQGNPYLSQFYADPKRWALTMQLHLLNTRFRMHKNAQWTAMQSGKNVVIDRSYFGDTAFARLQVKNKDLTEDEYNTYKLCYQNMTANILLPQICIHLITTPEVSSKRIGRRMEIETGRTCENVIDLQYLEDLRIEESIMIDTLEKQGVKIYNLDWNSDQTESEIRFTIKKLIEELNKYVVPDMLLDYHRRTI
jgi:deoxyadenosine/deoxycytidine kinase